ncbi:MAG: hypothetical protein GY859_37040 [Desulfobacterales bacterium]|nr:hypothetical protein [Desulfobacterales bacterium]
MEAGKGGGSLAAGDNRRGKKNAPGVACRFASPGAPRKEELGPVFRL